MANPVAGPFGYGVVGICVIHAIAGVILSPILVPTAIVVGLIGAPIFGLKALGHKVSLESLKKAKTYSNQNEIDKLVAKREIRNSIAKMKSFAVCIIPLGFISQMIRPISSKRAIELNENILNLQKRN